MQANETPTNGKRFPDGLSEVGRSIKERIDRDAEAAEQREHIKRWVHSTTLYRVSLFAG